VVSSPPRRFISVLGSSLFSTSTSHSLVLNWFCFFGRPVSCFRSAAGTKLEMGCSLAAHPGKQRHAMCLGTAPQLPFGRPREPQTWVQPSGEGERCRSPVRGAGDSSGSRPAPLARQQPWPCSQGLCNLLCWGQSSPGDPPGHCDVLVPITVTHRSTWGGLSSGRHRKLVWGAERPLSSFSSRLLNLTTSVISSLLTWQFFQQVPSKCL